MTEARGMAGLLLLHPGDNVAVAPKGLLKGEELPLAGGTLRALHDIPALHKVAIEDIPRGGEVLKYGAGIGRATRSIEEGEWVHNHNMESMRGRGDLMAPPHIEPFHNHPHTFPVPGIEPPKDSRPGEYPLLLYPRGGEGWGVRDYILILSMTVCANSVVRGIKAYFPSLDVVYIPLSCGCGQIGEDWNLSMKVLKGLAVHPNVGGLLVVELGCQGLLAGEVSGAASSAGKATGHLSIQEEGGVKKSIGKGVEIVRGMLKEKRRRRRETASLSDLIIGVECGGSDATSGISANPLAGAVADRVVDCGGTVVFSETPETMGAEGILLSRMKGEDERSAYSSCVKRYEEEAGRLGVSLLGGQPGPGNREGGITTVEEKSLGAISKSGTRPISGVLGYGDPIRGRGLFFMDSPGQDVESMTGMGAGGAHIFLFTTGRGTPAGFTLSPTIKICANRETVRGMRGDIDFDASPLMRGAAIDRVRDELFALLLRIAGGRRVRAEINDSLEASPFRLALTF